MNILKALPRAMYVLTMTFFMVEFCHSQFQNKLDRNFKQGRCPGGYVCGFGDDERSIEKAKERAEKKAAKASHTHLGPALLHSDSGGVGIGVRLRPALDHSDSGF